MLESDIHVSLDGFTLNASLRVGDDEIVAVVGPNGAGKTTLLRALAGLEGGAPIADRVGYVPQDDYLFSNMDVLRNVAFGSDRATASRFIELVGMGLYSGRKPSELSGGQRKRVAIARALAREPKVLLLDEPFEGLDIATKRDVRTYVRECSGARIVVSHHPVDALALADRVVVLEEGRVAQDGTPDELIVHPRSRYVADLVGTNLYRGTFAGNVLHTDAGAEIVTSRAPTGNGFVTIHPHAVALFPERPAGSPRNGWAGRVVAVESAGDILRVRIDGEIAIVAELTPAATNELALAPGSSVYASVKATEIGVETD